MLAFQRFDLDLIPSTARPAKAAKAANVPRDGGPKRGALAGLATLATGELPPTAGAEWGDETAALVQWFLSTTPPARPFALYPGVWIAHPARWWESIRVDIADGPGKGRAYYGALEKDLRRLADLFGDRNVTSEPTINTGA
jgi:hypothetical protein